MNQLFLLIFITLGSLIFIRHRVRRYLRYFQQEDYSNRRFIRWFLHHKAFDRKGTALACSCAALETFFPFPLWIGMIGALGLWILSKKEEDPTKQGKRLLHMTPRAARIDRTALGLSGGALVLGGLLFSSSISFWLFQAVLFQCIPGWLLIAKVLLQPHEDQQQQAYIREAKRHLQYVSPYVIGITGSYGKTSTKDALGQLLQITHAPTFWPSKGVNTPMGITREIREHLKPGHAFAVIEMAAYGKGSIQRLCHLTPPQAGLITSIGVAHLERFGSQDTIYRTKSELAEAIPVEGILVCNGDDPLVRKIAQTHAKKTPLLYGLDAASGPLDSWISQWTSHLEGTRFTLHWNGKIFEGSTPLQGATALSNLLGAFTMACALGSDPDYALAVIRNLEPVDNRLELRKEGEIVYVRDAYNSNPRGFSAALDLMAALPVKRRILMTPGMIELGALQAEEHEKLGRKAGAICQMALVVGEHNKATLIKGLKEGGMAPEYIHCCPTRQHAFEKWAQLKQEGDALLIENDLPDLYESIHTF